MREAKGRLGFGASIGSSSWKWTSADAGHGPRPRLATPAGAGVSRMARAAGGGVEADHHRRLGALKLPATQRVAAMTAPFDMHGFTTDDVIDFTPELRAEAIRLLKPYVLGPAFTPPSLKSREPGRTKGTFTVPGPWDRERRQRGLRSRNGDLD